MRRRSGRSRRTDPATDIVSPVPVSGVNWSDLSEAERTALKRMNRGRHTALPETMGLRLVDLGLAVSRPDGIGISRRGRELVIETLLDTRQRD